MKVIIIGSGVAGLFAADVLLSAGAEVVMLERGQAMGRRVCPPGPACECRVCDVLIGEGGAGSWSDGKITLSANRGTHTRELFTPEQGELLGIVDDRLRRFVSAAVDYPPAPAPDTTGTGLRFESYPLLHVGSDGVRKFGADYSRHLQERGLDLRTATTATALLTTGARVTGVAANSRRDKAETVLEADAVIAASGMAGTPWLEAELTRLGVPLDTGPADIGIRLETSAAALDPFIGAFYDFKAHHTFGGLDLRSFCVNGRGYIITEYHQDLGIRGVNGHSFLDRQSEQSNLAIVATIQPEDVPDPKAFVRAAAGGVNDGGAGYPVRQLLADFLGPDLVGPANGVTASNPKSVLGPLRELLPEPLGNAFASYILSLGKAMPPVLGEDTVLYGPEIKYYNRVVPIDLETWASTDLDGLYVVGNAAGRTASLSAAALSGIIAGRALTA
ncbi:FAD-dependent monooxygenase [Longispora sp. NPDC051575]|uniref:FAD-dependent monooxygenase n=1 Tax=Longispora sp. NPDC051575 TaxID=3154943 RepID=UPI003414BAFF